MSDFAGGIRKSVQAARESAKQQEDALRRQEEGEAEDAGDGAIKVERRSGTALTTFQLWWQEGQPERALQIVVDETEGVIQASWVVAPGYGQSVDAPSLEASRFDMAKLESAIELLVDPRRWSRGAMPMIPW